ncbi:MAG: OmpA family protein [Bacteroidales bacterium]|nr:OmpA family protein [Bacteroidales bacterium]
MRNSYLICVIILGLLLSCVPIKQYRDLKDKNEQCEDERSYLKNREKELSEKNKELEQQLSVLQNKYNSLRMDTSSMGYTIRTYASQIERLTNLNAELNQLLKKKTFEISAENKKLLTHLQLLQDSLLKKEDELKRLEREINKKKFNVDSLFTELNKKTELLNQKSNRLIELERKLKEKDSVVIALKDKISKALKGYEGQGLSVNIKNGKVYVSLEERLLFASGRWDVDPKGQKALKSLAEVLEKNTDINIIVEGHTDDVPYKGSGNIEDNWDLSTKRATAVTKILLKSGNIDPSRIMAAGRGEYMPIEKSKTSEARAKNRRTEIILTPKLEEVLKILETN